MAKKLKEFEYELWFEDFSGRVMAENKKQAMDKAINKFLKKVMGPPNTTQKARIGRVRRMLNKTHTFVDKP